MSKKEKKSSGVGKFIAGAAVGATLGILFAPKSGKETRQDLKRIFDDFMKKVKEIDVQEVKEQLEAKIEEIRTGLADLDREKALKIAKERATAVKEKCEELVQLAVAKGTPVLEKAADEVRSKTIEAVREILARLEESDRKAKAKS